MLEKEINEFKEILKETCSHRFKVEEILDWLKNSTDFFEAPASTKFHLNEKGGLLKHSLNVYHNLSNLCELYYEDCPKDTITITALFHDLCKINYYKQSIKSVKGKFGWSDEVVYTIDDDLPLGHGEKSVIILLSKGISLTKEEMLAIRWHMGGFDSSTKGGDQSSSKANSIAKLLSLLQSADIISTFITENT